MPARASARVTAMRRVEAAQNRKSLATVAEEPKQQIQQEVGDEKEKHVRNIFAKRHIYSLAKAAISNQKPKDPSENVSELDSERGQQLKASQKVTLRTLTSAVIKGVKLNAVKFKAVDGLMMLSHRRRLELQLMQIVGDSLSAKSSRNWGQLVVRLEELLRDSEAIRIRHPNDEDLEEFVQEVKDLLECINRQLESKQMMGKLVNNLKNIKGVMGRTAVEAEVLWDELISTGNAVKASKESSGDFRKAFDGLVRVSARLQQQRRLSMQRRSQAGEAGDGGAGEIEESLAEDLLATLSESAKSELEELVAEGSAEGETDALRKLTELGADKHEARCIVEVIRGRQFNATIEDAVSGLLDETMAETLSLDRAREEAQEQLEEHFPELVELKRQQQRQERGSPRRTVCWTRTRVKSCVNGLRCDAVPDDVKDRHALSGKRKTVTFASPTPRGTVKKFSATAMPLLPLSISSAAEPDAAGGGEAHLAGAAQGSRRGRQSQKRGTLRDILDDGTSSPGFTEGSSSSECSGSDASTPDYGLFARRHKALKDSVHARHKEYTPDTTKVATDANQEPASHLGSAWAAARSLGFWLNTRKDFDKVDRKRTVVLTVFGSAARRVMPKGQRRRGSLSSALRHWQAETRAVGDPGTLQLGRPKEGSDEQASSGERHKGNLQRGTSRPRAEEDLDSAAPGNVLRGNALVRTEQSRDVKLALPVLGALTTRTKAAVSGRRWRKAAGQQAAEMDPVFGFLPDPASPPAPAAAAKPGPLQVRRAGSQKSAEILVTTGTSSSSTAPPPKSSSTQPARSPQPAAASRQVTVSAAEEQAGPESLTPTREDTTLAHGQLHFQQHFVHNGGMEKFVRKVLANRGPTTVEMFTEGEPRGGLGAEVGAGPGGGGGGGGGEEWPPGVGGEERPGVQPPPLPHLAGEPCTGPGMEGMEDGASPCEGGGSGGSSAEDVPSQVAASMDSCVGYITFETEEAAQAVLEGGLPELSEAGIQVSVLPASALTAPEEGEEEEDEWAALGAGSPFSADESFEEEEEFSGAKLQTTGALRPAVEDLQRHVVERFGSVEAAIEDLGIDNGNAGENCFIPVPVLHDVLGQAGYVRSLAEVAVLFRALGLDCEEAGELAREDVLRLVDPCRWLLPSGSPEALALGALLGTLSLRRMLLGSLEGPQVLLAQVYSCLAAASRGEKDAQHADLHLAAALRRCSMALRKRGSEEVAEALLSRTGLRSLSAAAASPNLSLRTRQVALGVIAQALEARGGPAFSAKHAKEKLASSLARGQEAAGESSAEESSDDSSLGAEPGSSARGGGPRASAAGGRKLEAFLASDLWRPLLASLDPHPSPPTAQLVPVDGPFLRQLLALFLQARVPRAVAGVRDKKLAPQVIAALCWLHEDRAQAIQYLEYLELLERSYPNEGVATLAAALGGCRLLRQQLCRLPLAETELRRRGVRLLQEWHQARLRLLARHPWKQRGTKEGAQLKSLARVVLLAEAEGFETCWPQMATSRSGASSKEPAQRRLLEETPEVPEHAEKPDVPVDVGEISIALDEEPSGGGGFEIERLVMERLARRQELLPKAVPKLQTLPLAAPAQGRPGPASARLPGVDRLPPLPVRAKSAREHNPADRPRVPLVSVEEPLRFAKALKSLPAAAAAGKTPSAILPDISKSGTLAPGRPGALRAQAGAG